MTKSLAGKLTLVTGASRGIGKAIAMRLAEEGARVCIHYGTSQQEALAVSNAILSRGGHSFVLRADLAQLDEISLLADAVCDAGGGGIDVLVNNAGIGNVGTISETDEPLYDRLFDVNLKAMFFLTKALMERINDGGRVINVSSTVSLSAYPNCIAYAMSKAGVNSFTQSLAQELGVRSITVNAVAPGITATELVEPFLENEAFAQSFVSRTALGRIGSPSDVADVVAFLASKASGWVTGQTLSVCGGCDL